MNREQDEARRLRIAKTYLQEPMLSRNKDMIMREDLRDWRKAQQRRRCTCECHKCNKCGCDTVFEDGE